uniref:BEN domain containing 5 n=1 Tax=Callithrix jacchus TaxID=9483 RepID=A0A8I3WGC8_CALJA
MISYTKERECSLLMLGGNIIKLVSSGWTLMILTQWLRNKRKASSPFPLGFPATHQPLDSAFLAFLSNHLSFYLVDNLREGAERKVVFITGRVHPGETPSSFVCQGIINFLVSQHPIARVLREYLVFKIAPMLNPDGVYLGNYRCSLMGFDLNRHWLDPSPWAHPTLHGVKQLIIQMYNDPKTSLEFYIDIHAHSTMMNGFMYGNIFEDEERFQRQAIFPKLLCQNAEDFSYSSTSFNRDAVKAGTGRRFLGGLLDHTSYCYTLEVSFYSYIVSGTTAAVPYTEEACHRIRAVTDHDQFCFPVSFVSG